MKIKLLSLLIVASCHAGEIDPAYADKVASAIYAAEGGSKTRFAYGVKSVKTHSTADARRVTLTSIRNNWNRWQAAGSPGSFIEFMADRWCPKAADAVGNRNWKRNVQFFVDK